MNPLLWDEVAARHSATEKQKDKDFKGDASDPDRANDDALHKAVSGVPVKNKNPDKEKSTKPVIGRRG